MDEKVQITCDGGKVVEATAPVIISASRSTDIPAFYAEWFINRLTAGYVVWYNPFNQKPMYVSFMNTKVIVFWTKNPEPIIKYLPELDKIGIHYYFQFTLNDYEDEGFEPNVPRLDERIEIFKKLSKLIGKEKVIWRFDPIIISPTLSVRQVLTKIWNVGNRLKGCTDKLVFSFVDIATYRKVQNNLIKETNVFSKNNICDAELRESQMIEIAKGLAKCRDRWRTEGWKLSIGTCAEKIDLEQYGIEHNRCIDGELIKRVFSKDKDLVYYINHGKLPDKSSLFAGEDKTVDIKKLKDKGQRKACGCMISKDIGMYNTCRHFCVYCYANASKQLVTSNALKHNDTSESLVE